MKKFSFLWGTNRLFRRLRGRLFHRPCRLLLSLLLPRPHFRRNYQRIAQRRYLPQVQRRFQLLNQRSHQRCGLQPRNPQPMTQPCLQHQKHYLEISNFSKKVTLRNFYLSRTFQRKIWNQNQLISFWICWGTCFANPADMDEWSVYTIGLFWAWASPCSGGCPPIGSLPHASNYEGSCCWRFALPEEWERKPALASFYDPKNGVSKCAAHVFDPTYTHCNYQRYDIVRTYDSYGWNNLWIVCGKQNILPQQKFLHL